MNYISLEREVNKHSENLNRKAITDKSYDHTVIFSNKLEWSYLEGRSIEWTKFWCEKIS